MRLRTIMGFTEVMRTTVFVAVVTASILTMWTPANIFSNQAIKDLVSSSGETDVTAVAYPTPTSPPLQKVGIIAGHWQNDSGSVCSDGLTEMEVNLRIATLVRQYLLEAGDYTVEILPEYSDQLDGYQAMALISIHNDSCLYISDDATGFKVAADANTNFPDKSRRLKACLVHRYIEATDMFYHYYSITEHMRDYHAFNQISDDTPAAIVETGFLNLDREYLLNNTEQVAQGIANGILCYLRSEPVPIQEILPDEELQ